jgi:hypothetical protein
MRKGKNQLRIGWTGQLCCFWYCKSHNLHNLHDSHDPRDSRGNRINLLICLIRERNRTEMGIWGSLWLGTFSFFGNLHVRSHLYPKKREDRREKKRYGSSPRSRILHRPWVLDTIQFVACAILYTNTVNNCGGWNWIRHAIPNSFIHFMPKHDPARILHPRSPTKETHQNGW